MADLELIHQMTLVDLTSKNSMTLFKNMNLLGDFLKFPADQWNHQSSFNDAKSFVSSMAITNDHAERSIALKESFSSQFTRMKYSCNSPRKLLLIIAKSFLNSQQF